MQEVFKNKKRFIALFFKLLLLGSPKYYGAKSLKTGIMELEDLKPDMIMTGTVRNVTDFGAFVDIGVHQDGLVHISQLSDKYVKHPMDIVQVGDIVTVKVLDVDVIRKRIALTMKNI